MKQVLVFIFLLLAPLTITAQMQSGYVRTKGTFSNPQGKPLGQVIITINEVPGVQTSGADGKFQFSIKDKNTCTVTKVASPPKKNYECIVNPPFTYNVGKASLVIVMQDKDQDKKDRELLIKQLEKDFKKGYDQQVAKLMKELQDAQDKKLKQEITDLQKKLKELEDINSNREKIISQIANEYIKIDFATLDEKKQKLFSYIQKGDIENAYKVLNSFDENNIEKQISEKKKRLSEYQKKMEEEQEDLRQLMETRCMLFRSRYTLAVMTARYDSAAYYMQQLVEVDTTNFANVYECAKFFRNQDHYPLAEKYYLMSIRQAKTIDEEQNDEESKAQYARALNGLGYFYVKNKRYQKAKQHLEQAYTLRKQLAEKNIEKYNSSFAATMIHLAEVYQAEGKMEKAEDYYKQTVEIDRQMLSQNNTTDNKDNLANAYNKLGAMYYDQQRNNDALELHQEAVKLYREIAALTPKTPNADLANALRMTAADYDAMGESAREQECLKEALNIMNALVKKNPRAYIEEYVRLQNDFAMFYSVQKDYKTALDCHNKAVELSKRMVEENPLKYNPRLALSYRNLAGLYVKMDETDMAEDYYKKAEAIYSDLAEADSLVYKDVLCDTYYDIAVFYYGQSESAKAMEYYEKYMNLVPQLYSEDTFRYAEELVYAYNIVSAIYNDNKEYKLAEEYIKMGLKMAETLVAINQEKGNPLLAACYYAIGVLENNKGDRKAEKSYRKSLEIYQRLAETNPKVYNEDLAEAYKVLANYYSKNSKNDKEVENNYQESYALLKELCNQNPQRYHEQFTNACRRLIDYYDNRERYEASTPLCQEVLSLYENLCKEDSVRYIGELAGAYLMQGDNSDNLDELDNCVVAYSKAADIYTQLSEKGDTKYEAGKDNAQNKLTAVNERIGATDASFNALGDIEVNEADTLSQDMNRMIDAYKALANKYDKAEDYGKQIYYLARLAQLYESVENPGQSTLWHHASTYFDTGVAYFLIGHVDDSRVSFQKSIDLYKKVPKLNSNAGLLCLLAYSYKDLGLTYYDSTDKKDLKLSMKHLNTALRLFKKAVSKNPEYDKGDIKDIQEYIVNIKEKLKTAH